MSFAQFQQALTDSFLSAGVPAKVQLGRTHLAQEPARVPEDGSFLRVVLVPTTMQYGPPIDIGGNPPARANRRQSLDVYVHARAATQPDTTTQHEADLLLAEALAYQVVLAVYDNFEGSSEPGGGGFSTEGPIDIGFGVALRFSVAVDISVVPAPWAVVDDADPTLQGAIVNTSTGFETEGMGVG
jgi:hypothetical protein